MARLPDVPNVIRLRFLWTIAGKPLQGNRIFISYTGDAPAVADLEYFADALETEMAVAVPEICSSTVSWTGAILEDLSSATGAVYELVQTIVGSRSGEPVTPAQAFVTSFEIAKRYRGGHSRTYWPFGTATDSENDPSWTDDFVTDALGYVNAIIASVLGLSHGSTTTADQVAVHYYSGFTAVENPLTGRYRNVPTLLETPDVYTVTSLIGRTYFGSQRRRRPKTSPS